MRSIVLAWFFVASFGAASDYYVSPSGSDKQDGRSLKSAWQSVSHAATEDLAPGDTVHVRGGVYNELVEVEVSGAPGKPIVFRPYQNEVPILDGSDLPVKGETALLLLKDINHVVFRGFEIRNLQTDLARKVPIGVLVTGSSSHIELRNNKIHSIETNFKKKNGGDAHGLAVFGTKMKPSNGIVIDGNELYNLKLGSSEALVLNGNVTNFEVTNNIVHDCNNIALDFIGFEKIAPKPNVDQVRDGVCVGNHIYNIDSRGNPAYGKDRSAGGIYVDGGTNMVISRNRITNCNIGVELASEHKGRSTSHISLHNNLIYKNQIGGIFIGGYNKKRGLTEHCEIRNNTLYHNDTQHDGNGELYLQFGTRNNSISQNIFIANDQNLFIANPFVENADNIFGPNLFYCADEPKFAKFQWKKQRYKGWQDWRLSGYAKHAIFAAPGFVDPANNNFKLKAESPAANAGDPKFKPVAGETDFLKAPRLVGKAIDLGALECH